jgi:hypothetical protein
LSGCSLPRHSTNKCSGTDPKTAIQYVKAARTAEPGNIEWTAWLAKIYASAIRWTYLDGTARMSFTGSEKDFRYAVPFTLPLELRQGARAEIEPSILTPELPQFRKFGQGLVERARALRTKPRG